MKNDKSGWGNSVLAFKLRASDFENSFIIEIIYYGSTAAPFHFYSNLLIKLVSEEKNNIFQATVKAVTQFLKLCHSDA